MSANQVARFFPENEARYRRHFETLYTRVA
jgi:hypothetical protein